MSSEKLPYKIIPLNEGNTHLRLQIFSLMCKYIMLGKCSFFTLSDYYDFNDYNKSPIVLTRDPGFIKKFFFDLLNDVGYSLEEIRLFCNFIQDKNGVKFTSSLPLEKPQIGKFISDTKIFIILDAISDLLSQLYLTPIDIYEGYDPALVKECENNLTLGNMIYLRCFGIKP